MRVDAFLDRLCDPANYLGPSGVMIDRVLASLETSSHPPATRRLENAE